MDVDCRPGTLIGAATSSVTGQVVAGSEPVERYVGEFDFCYDTGRLADMNRAILAVEGIKGKRLTYRRVGQAAVA